MLPSPTDLSNFVQIANYLNITRAAERLGVTQPTLSVSLKRLEDSLKEELVVRSKSGIALTVAGKKLLTHTNELLTYWEKTKMETRNSVHEICGTIRIGCHPAVGLYALDKFLPEVTKLYEKLEISLVHDLSRVISEKVINHDLDLGLVINPLRHPDLVLTKLLDDEVKIWSARDAVPPVLICHPDLTQTKSILKKVKARNQKFERVMTSDSLEIITQLTAAGCGYGVIPSRVVQTLNHGKKLVALAEYPVFKDELYLVYRRERRKVEYIKVLKDLIRARLGQ